MATANTTPKIVALVLLDNDQREIEICLTTGQRVSVYGSNGGYVQYGQGDGPLGSEAQKVYGFTQPIAQRWAKWLNGGKRPQPSTRYAEFTDLHAYENVAGLYPQPVYQPLPSLTDWKCYYFDDKQNSYDIEQDGVKYSITPIVSNTTGKLLGWSLQQFTQQDGHQSIRLDGSIGYTAPNGTFARAASAAKIARQVHASRPA